MVVIFAVLFFINTRLALIAAAIAPLIVIIALGFSAAGGAARRSRRAALAEVNAKVQETVSGIGVAKAFRQEETIYQEFNQVNTQSYGTQPAHRRIRRYLPVLNAVAGVGTAFVVYFGGMSVLDGQVSPGRLVSLRRDALLVPADGHRPPSGASSNWACRPASAPADRDDRAGADHYRSAVDRTGASSFAAPPSATPNRSRCCATST